MRDEMRVLLDSGEEVEVTTVLTQMLRLQQIVCGYITKDGEVVDVGSSDRLEALDNVLEQVSGPSVIWCRFRPDVVKVAAHLDNPSKVIETLTGDTTPTDVRRIAERFRKGEVDFLVATQAKASRGLNLQGSSLNAIYYSQSFSAEQRWQSEDRLHRIGVNGTVMCHDIIAERTIDNHIVRALKRKKSLSDMTLDDLRKVLD
jgi:SNF2 family DNA or RNA helicase